MTLRTGRIYKIVHSQSDAIYIGSTFNTLTQRFSSHKSFTGNCKISELIKQYGPEQFKIMLIKEYQVVDKKHLLAYESLWISKLRCINVITPFRVEKMYRKQYYAREDVKQRCSEYNKQHYEHRRELRKKYKEQEKEYKINRLATMPKFNCDICGGSCYMDSRLRHLRGKKHLEALANQEVN